MILTNKHVVIAMIVAPILAVIAYFGVDKIVSPPPEEALAGSDYPLVAKSNCRYKSGKCSMKNGDIEIEIKASNIDESAKEITFSLTSGLPLQGAKIALAAEGTNTAPSTMETANYQQTEWRASLQQLSDNDKLRVVIMLNDSIYFGETETTFINYETSFPRDNIR
ncbi:MAG: hypothetical protein ACRBBR_15495 [Cellvibrionaceae bacterium]